MTYPTRRDLTVTSLGTYIGENTHLTKLDVKLGDHIALYTTNEELYVRLLAIELKITDREFFDGLQQNSSISTVELDCSNNVLVGGVAEEILSACQINNNNNLAVLRITYVSLSNGGDTIITTTLRMCTNLIKIELFDCNITGEQLLQMVEAVRGHRSLKILDLESNRIGNAGCEVLDTLLHDPSCNLQILDLRRNNIDNEGATILANGLANNTKLKSLILYNNQIDQSVQDVFSKLLCNVSSINSMHSSNHTLEELGLPQGLPQPLSLLKLNREGTNKRHVAIKKNSKISPQY